MDATECGRRIPIRTVPLRAAIYAFVLLLTPATALGDAPWTEPDSWYRESATHDLSPWAWKRNDFFLVPARTQREAQSLLEESAAVGISSDQVTRFLGKAVSPPEGTRFFLLRGVALNEETGVFSVFSRDQLVWVYHGSLGRSPVPMKRRALIAALQDQPHEVYVTCTMDE
jgi:hypothetical protein